MALCQILGTVWTITGTSNKLPSMGRSVGPKNPADYLGGIMTNERLMGLYTAALIVQNMAGDKASPYSHKIMQYYTTEALKMERDNDQGN